MQQRGIHATRSYRFGKLPLISDKEIKKKNTGYNEELISTGGIIIWKWFHNRCVSLASKFVGVGKKDTVKSWDKSKKSILISRVLELYDCLMIAKSKSYRVWVSYNRPRITNSWIESRRNAKKQVIPKNTRMDSLEFRMRLAECIIKLGKPADNTRKSWSC